MAGTTINDRILDSLKSITTDKSTSNSMKTDLDLQTTDWLTLLVAQLKNQDMYNQTDSSEMTKQMAQYSQIQAIQNMVSLQENIYAMNTTSYAASLIGKEVTAAQIEKVTDSTGTTDKLVTTKGVITGVTLFEGEPVVYIGEKAFSLNQIMLVGDVPTGEESSDPTEDETTAGNQSENDTNSTESENND